VLANYRHVCQIQGPRWTGYATTVDHILPSSQYPELFWNPENLEAACRRCNYGDGACVAAENTRQTIERLQQIIGEQQAQIDRLLEKARRLRSRRAREACRARIAHASDPPSPALAELTTASARVEPATMPKGGPVTSLPSND
jgi:uncharacterized coiled-coil protein SlyX